MARSIRQDIDVLGAFDYAAEPTERAVKKWVFRRFPANCPVQVVIGSRVNEGLSIVSMETPLPNATDRSLSVVPELVDPRRDPKLPLFLKRGVDLTLGTLLALIALPAIVALFIGSALSLRAWPIFVQRRVGQDGQLFAFLKVRTLPTTTSPVADKYDLAELRVPRFCRLLRRSHLDELPQLLLVPIGKMSLVGPRPEMPTVLAHYDADFAVARSRVRPGCTGLWQIGSSSHKMIYEDPEYDLTYLRQGGLRLDFWILGRTARSLLPRSRAIQLADVPSWAAGDGFLPSESVEQSVPLAASVEASNA